MQYILYDSADPPHSALVEVTRNFLIGDRVEWRCLAEGAFTSDLPTNTRQCATRFANGKVICYLGNKEGEVFSVFVMLKYFFDRSLLGDATGVGHWLAHDEGTGTLFDQGCGGGNMVAGPMRWKKN